MPSYSHDNQNKNNNIILQELRQFIAGIAGIDGTYQMMVYDTNNGPNDQVGHLGRLPCLGSVQLTLTWGLKHVF